MCLSYGTPHGAAGDGVVVISQPKSLLWLSILRFHFPCVVIFTLSLSSPLGFDPLHVQLLTSGESAGSHPGWHVCDGAVTHPTAAPSDRLLFKTNHSLQHSNGEVEKLSYPGNLINLHKSGYTAASLNLKKKPWYNQIVCTSETSTTLQTSLSHDTLLFFYLLI